MTESKAVLEANVSYEVLHRPSSIILKPQKASSILPLKYQSRH